MLRDDNAAATEFISTRDNVARSVKIAAEEAIRELELQVGYGISYA